jgi:outer membrane protein assembly factor BamB
VRGARRAAASLAASALALALVAGCGGGGGRDETQASAPLFDGPPVVVSVVDGDTGAPVGGVEVSGLRGGAVIARATSDAAGRTTLPLGVGVVTADPRPYSPARARVHVGAAEVALYDPRLQSPQYGGGPGRDRSVPGVRAGPPSGAPAWRFESRTLLEFPPAVRDGLVVIGNNAGRVYALDAGDGKLRWARRQRGEIASTPAITRDAVYMSSMDGSLVRYGLAGTTLWTFSSSGSPIESSPLVVGGLVYVGAHDGRLYAVDARTGRARWTFQAPAAIKGSAARAGRLVVVGDYAGQVHALDARTGAERWTYSGGVRFYGGPGVSGTTIVIGDVGGAIVALDARDGSELWRHSTGGAFVYSSPAIAGGTVFIGSYDGVFRALDLASGAVRWSFDVGGPISGSATVVDGVVYVSRLYAPGQPRRTYGLDAVTGAVRAQIDDGRYSPAVGAGRTLYLVGTRTLRAYPAPAP